MKKKYTPIRFATILALIVGLTSCGESTPKATKIQPTSTQIKGDLANCYSVIEGEYELTSESSYSWLITIEIARTSADLPFDPEVTDPFGVNSNNKNCHVGFGIEILDESGTPILSKNANEGGLGGPYSHKDVEGLIDLQAGSTAYIRWRIDLDTEELAKAKSFRITSAMKSNGTAPSTAVTSSASGSSAKWDEILDSYESFTDKYIELANKVKAGNTNVMNEFHKCMDEAQKFQTQLSNAQSNMSAAQVSRMTKIAAKMTTAATKI